MEKTMKKMTEKKRMTTKTMTAKIMTTKRMTTKTMTANENFRKNKRCLAVLMAVVLFFAFAIPQQIEAAEGYIATWKEYQESGAPASTWNDVANAMDAVLDCGKELFEAGDLKGAYKAVQDAYYGYYETTGFERRAMGYISGSRKTEMELQFSACKSVAKKEGTLEDFTAQVDLLEAMLHEDANKLDGVSSDGNGESSEGSEGSGSAGGEESTGTTSTSSQAATRSAAMATFIACFGIILREGLEAILIVGAIIAYLHKGAGDDEERRRKTLRPVYIGSLLGIVMSFGLAWLLAAIKLANTASQELIEGITALLAVCVLYYVSNWMFSKSETDAWVSYIKDKAETTSAKGSFFALGFTAFLAVFREGAEVVLFFQPLMSDENIHMVWIGLIVGFVVLALVYLAIHYLSLRIPTKPFFLATSILMYIMSISFLGAGIKELIEADVITMSSPAWVAWIPTNDFLDVLGIYPCVQTIVPQLILLAITIVLVVIQAKKNRQIHEEAEARRAEEAAVKAAEEKKAADEALRKVVREVVLNVLQEQGLVKASAADK